MDKLRNFCIVAHIDHGKSTLADRLIELTGTVEKRAMRTQLLDTMELEREKGITIKLQPVRMHWRGYTLNLIDTPGHVDFSYEVSRSLAACEGALLVVDAAQGIQAQTLANIYLAIEAGLTIIPVINKIDLPAAEPDKVATEISNVIGYQPGTILRVSAKDGTHVEEVLDRIVSDIQPPKGDSNGPPRALVFDSVYDEYRGVVLFVRIVDGQVKRNDTIYLMGSAKLALSVEVGHFAPDKVADSVIETGQIGYIVTNLKSIGEAQVGDTITLSNHKATYALPGYTKIKPYVYAGFFPASGEDHSTLKDALTKLKLNDAALEYIPENSLVLGFGFRLGFLGLLHLDIVKERLEREYNLSLVVTNPSVDYEITTTDDKELTVKNAADLPDPSRTHEIREPWIKGEIVVPSQYVGSIIQLVTNVRGRQSDLSYLEETLAVVSFEAPLANVLTDFYDQLKSLTAGYGSLNYDLVGYRADKLVRLDVLVGGELVDSLSLIVHRDEAEKIGRSIVEKLKAVIPRQLFEVSLQAAVGLKVIARDDIKALGKNVTAKLYGGDVTRKNKLLDKQKKGKARMKKIGKVEIPPEAFMVLVKKN